MSSLRQLMADLRYAARSLARSRGFSAGVMGLVALGTAAAVAIFGVLDAVVLQPLPYANPDRLVMVWTNFSDQGLEHLSASPPEFRDIQSAKTSLESVAGFVSGDLNLLTGGEPLRTRATWVTEDFFDTLGVGTRLGTSFTREDQLESSERSVILSDALWRDRFGSRSDIVGSVIDLGGRQYLVRGVMGPGFHAIHEADLWVPLRLNAEDTADAARGNHYLRLVGRLTNDATVERIESELGLLAARLEERFPDTNRNHGFEVVPLEQEILGDERPRLLITFVSVSVLLLLVCFNGMNLMIARTIRRSRDLSIRMALGATRRRLSRLLFFESLIIAASGSALGTIAGANAAAWFLASSSALLPRQAPALSIARLVPFVLIMTLGVALAFAIAPSLGLLRRRMFDLLGSRSAGSAAVPAHTSLLALEVALAIVILIGSGLAIRSYGQLVAVDPGWQPDGLVTMRFQLPSQTYEDDQVRSFVDRLLESARASGAIDHASVSDAFPLAGQGNDRSFFIEGSDFSFAQREPTAVVRVVSEDFFRTLGIPLREGRPIVAADEKQSPPVAVVSASFARRYWPDSSAVGRRVTFDDVRETPTWMEIVGVAGDVRSANLGEDPPLEIYVPFRQRPSSSLFLAVRSKGNQAVAVDVVRDAIRRLDASLPLFDVVSSETLLDRAKATGQITASVLGTFGAVALVLAATGIFAVVSYLVSSRTTEIGVRMAIGATARNILVLVIERSMRPVVLGIVLGVLTSLAISRTLSRIVYGISPVDAVTYGAVVMLMVVAALAASLAPGMRAARVDPALTMKDQ